MPICTVNLLALTTPSQLPTFLAALRTAYPDPSSAPLVTSRVIRWMITPTTLSVTPLLTQKPQWDLLLITRGSAPLPSSLTSHIAASFSLQTGVPSSLVSNFPETNKQLLHPEKGSVPPLTGALNRPRMADSAQNLEYTRDVAAFIETWDPEDDKGAVSMLNLLAFKEGMHGEYLKYGKAFGESIGRRRGGVAKVVGRVVHSGAKEEVEGWDEVALAHYPSIRHFADMAASEDYQEVNHKHRVGSLRDTCILCTSELELPVLAPQEDGLGLPAPKEEVVVEGKGKAELELPKEDGLGLPAPKEVVGEVKGKDKDKATAELNLPQDDGLGLPAPREVAGEVKEKAKL